MQSIERMGRPHVTCASGPRSGTVPPCRTAAGFHDGEVLVSSRGDDESEWFPFQCHLKSRPRFFSVPPRVVSCFSRCISRRHMMVVLAQSRQTSRLVPLLGLRRFESMTATCMTATTVHSDIRNRTPSPLLDQGMAAEQTGLQGEQGHIRFCRKS